MSIRLGAARAVSLGPAVFATLASMAEEKLEPSATCAAEPVPPDSMPSDRAHIPLLLILFVGSGCAALIYEIVWFQLLQLVVGSSAVSLGILLGTYMGGMCLGSLLLPPCRNSVISMPPSAAVVCSESLCVHWSRPCAYSHPHCYWARPFPRSPATSNRRHGVFPGSAISMPATSPVRCADPCSRVFICCASTTCRRPPISPSRSTSPSRFSAIACRCGPTTSRLRPTILPLVKRRRRPRHRATCTLPSGCPG